MGGRPQKGYHGNHSLPAYRPARDRLAAMLKRIRIEHLTLGMYLHEFCGSWMEHPFWRTKFVLKDPKDLARIQSTAIHEVWIDTSKGLDVAEGVSSVVYRSFCKFRFARGLLGGERRRVAPEVTAQQAARRWV